MNIIKRSGMEVLFEAQKIQNAVEKANRTVKEEEHLTSDQIVRIVQAVTTRCQELNRAAGVEETDGRTDRATLSSNYNLPLN